MVIGCKLQLPVTSCFYGVNCPDAYFKLSRQFTAINAFIQKHSDKENVPFIQNSPSVFGAFIGFMFNAIVNIFVWRSISKVAGGVVVPVTINVTHNHSLRSGADKRFRDHGMDVFGCLATIFRSFFKRHRKIYCRGIGLTDKSFSVSDRRYTPKTTNFVSFMFNHG